jgi:hypothetical protein
MANHDHGKDGRFVRTEQRAETDAKAVRLKAQGASYPAIARALGYASPGSAHKAVQRALAAIPAPGVRELRALQGEALDAIEVEAWRVLSSTHYKVSNSGRVVPDPHTGEPLHDPAPKIAAINALVRVSDRRAKLFGLDSPIRIEAAISADEAWAVLDAHQAELEAQIAALEGKHHDGPPAWHPES